VQSATVSFRDKEAHVAFDPDEVTVQQLIDAVNRPGFRASVKRLPPSW
jgi:copper chaperone CopZ